VSPSQRAGGKRRQERLQRFLGGFRSRRRRATSKEVEVALTEGMEATSNVRPAVSRRLEDDAREEAEKMVRRQRKEDRRGRRSMWNPGSAGGGDSRGTWRRFPREAPTTVAGEAAAVLLAGEAGGGGMRRVLVEVNRRTSCGFFYELSLFNELDCSYVEADISYPQRMRHVQVHCFYTHMCTL
jgi:hypothetical protein